MISRDKLCMSVLIIRFVCRCRETMAERRSRSSLENLRRRLVSGYPALGNPHKIVRPEGGVSSRGKGGGGGRETGGGTQVHGIRSSGLRIHERTLRSFLFFPPIYRQDILGTPLNRRPTFRENASPPLFLLSSLVSWECERYLAYNARDFTLNQPLKYEVIYRGIFYRTCKAWMHTIVHF